MGGGGLCVCVLFWVCVPHVGVHVCISVLFFSKTMVCRRLVAIARGLAWMRAGPRFLGKYRRICVLPGRGKATLVPGKVAAISVFSSVFTANFGSLLHDFFMRKYSNCVRNGQYGPQLFPENTSLEAAEAFARKHSFGRSRAPGEAETTSRRPPTYKQHGSSRVTHPGIGASGRLRSYSTRTSLAHDLETRSACCTCTRKDERGQRAVGLQLLIPGM